MSFCLRCRSRPVWRYSHSIRRNSGRIRATFRQHSDKTQAELAVVRTVIRQHSGNVPAVFRRFGHCRRFRHCRRFSSFRSFRSFSRYPSPLPQHAVVPRSLTILCRPEVHAVSDVLPSAIHGLSRITPFHESLAYGMYRLARETSFRRVLPFGIIWLPGFTGFRDSPASGIICPPELSGFPDQLASGMCRLQGVAAFRRSASATARMLFA